MKLKLLATCTALTLLSGCASNVPLSESYPISKQQHMQAAHHWNVLAEDVSKKIALGDLDGPVYVVSKNDDQIFDRGFKNLLLTQLSSSGVDVSRKRGAGVYNLEFDTQIIEHHNRDSSFPIKGSPIMLAAGVYAISEIAQNTPTGAALGLAGLGYHSGDLIGGTPNTEVFINTSIYGSNDLLKQRTSNIYYINRGDSSHYNNKPLTSMEVVSQ
jgi:hypothetical protein